MEITEHPAYREAFIRYLRKGTPIDISLKAATNLQSTSHYIWRTTGDDKVRPSHAVHDGRIFSWKEPPDVGRPGDDYNCRCIAEPYEENPYDIYDPPIESVYPELLLAPLLRVDGRVVNGLKKLLRRIGKGGKLKKPKKLTEHGAVRSAQRRITIEEAEEAIKTARKSGAVTEKIGKYGTPQLHYKGKNGVTVIVETTGRNAGKIITFWRRQH